MRITNIEGLKEQINIVEVLEKYLDLSKAGANFKASCPFHDERSASFMVSREKNIYKCFGCDASGDAIRFLQEYKKMSFAEAVEEIASLYHYKLEYAKNPKTERNERLKAVLAYANTLFKERLKNEERALHYLMHTRALLSPMIEAYDLGYCTPKELEILKNRFEHEDLILSGLFNNKEKNLKSFCNYRLTIPLKDSHGVIRSFAARSFVFLMPASVNAPKYLHGRETSLFNKSVFLYNYYRAKPFVLQKKQIIICEGFFDVMAYEHFGYLNAVCTLGTALSKEHLAFLEKLNVELCLSFDNDHAGLEATIRALELCWKMHITTVSVIAIKDASMKDLGDYQKANQRPCLSKMNGFEFYCAALFRNGLSAQQKDGNYKKILKTLERFEPFMRLFCTQILNKVLRQKQIAPVKEKPVQKLDLLEGRILLTMLISEEFRYVARRCLSPCDMGFPILFKRLVSGDFKGLDFLKQFKPLPLNSQKTALKEQKMKGLKNSLHDALRRKDYGLFQVLNDQIKAIQNAPLH
ncbi:DNA primase [Helicobacter acinonychis]|uniref:DNA primase n=1 Tax=Helicobacter acinonychis TaxID=212 RepID=UPI000CF13382|nr:DNA primase [Helicobacter acinonychis]